MKSSAHRKRIRGYEDAYRIHLPARTPVIIRVDGKAFHTLTKGFKRPFDERLMGAMDRTAVALCMEIQGAQLAYVQSDEITIFIRNYDKFTTSPWFDNVLQKMCSVSASIATAAFNTEIAEEHYKHGSPDVTGMFDSRVFCVPREEVCNVFVDRQQDCIRNSILAMGQHALGKKNIHGMSCDEIVASLDTAGSKFVVVPGERTTGEFSWRLLSSHEKYGRLVVKKSLSDERTYWMVVSETPIFHENKEVIDKLVWPEDEEGAYSKRSF